MDKLNQAGKLVSMAAGFKNLLDLGEVSLSFEPKTFKLHIIDRSVFINSYLISKPHAVGLNFEFISYIVGQGAGSKIEYKNLPHNLADDINKKTDKRFIKLLSDLNFTGVIRDLYFSEIKDDSLVFHGSLVNKKSAMKRNLIIKDIVSELDKFGSS
jgi:hypothetical protein